jgi:hypothetical protein
MRPPRSKIHNFFFFCNFLKYYFLIKANIADFVDFVYENLITTARGKFVFYLVICMRICGKTIYSLSTTLPKNSFIGRFFFLNKS